MPSSSGTLTAYQRPFPSPVSHRSPVPKHNTHIITVKHFWKGAHIFRSFIRRLTWEKSRGELVQRDSHDFGCEAESIFHTCWEQHGSEEKLSNRTWWWGIHLGAYRLHDAGQRPRKGPSRTSPSVWEFPTRRRSHNRNPTPRPCRQTRSRDLFIVFFLSASKTT